MKTYKFLANGATGPLSGFRWPEPTGTALGAWVESEGPLEQCSRGAHVCRPFDLAHWLHDELWETQADGDRIEGIDCLVVRRARLVRRIDGWHQGGAARFAEACTQHAADGCDRTNVNALGYVDDAAVAAHHGYPAIAAHSAALAVARSVDPSNEEAVYQRERLWQADWIVRSVIGA